MMGAGDFLFVYGTLRRGGSNDIARIAPAARWHGPGRVRGRLYDLGEYPALILDGAAGWVVGELYAVPAGAWASLDALEGLASADNPKGEYFRVECAVEEATGRSRGCQVYVGNPRALCLDRLIDSGDWMAYRAA